MPIATVMLNANSSSKPQLAKAKRRSQNPASKPTARIVSIRVASIPTGWISGWGKNQLSFAV